MPMLLRGLSPFSDSSRKGVDSDTVRHMYPLTTAQLFSQLDRFESNTCCLSLCHFTKSLYKLSILIISIAIN